MKFSSIVLMLFFSFNVFAVEVADYPATKIAKRTYVIHGPLESPNKINKGFMNNPGFVVTQSGVVVIDPGSSVQVGRMVLRNIKKITNKPVTHVLNTHVHGDHWLGNQAFSDAFPNVVVMAHPEMIKLAKAGAADSWVSLMSQLTEGASNGTRAVIPSKSVNSNYIFKTGGIQFRIHAPKKAHSHTDIMIEVIEDSVVFLGDNVLYKRLPRMDDATFKGNIAACKLALDLGAEKYVPGHGQSGDKNVVIPFMSYLSIISSEVAKHYEAGLTDFEMKPKILLKLENYFDWSGFEHEMGKHVSLAVLEYEKNSF